MRKLKRCWLLSRFRYDSLDLNQHGFNVHILVSRGLESHMQHEQKTATDHVFNGKFLLVNVLSVVSLPGNFCSSGLIAQSLLLAPEPELV